MVAVSQVMSGSIVSVGDKMYRVDSAVKVTVPKRAPFMKVKLVDINTNKSVEKNFKLTQQLKEVSLEERSLEFLYLEGKDYLFLDINKLDQILVPAHIVDDRVNYLKEGTPVTGQMFGEAIFAVELPQFLEITVSSVDGEEGSALGNSHKTAVLETGAKVSVPAYIQAGDIIRVDTKSEEFVQRI